MLSIQLLYIECGNIGKQYDSILHNRFTLDYKRKNILQKNKKCKFAYTSLRRHCAQPPEAS
jgi:hypothetical protein